MKLKAQAKCITGGMIRDDVIITLTRPRLLPAILHFTTTIEVLYSVQQFDWIVSLKQIMFNLPTRSFLDFVI